MDPIASRTRTPQTSRMQEPIRRASRPEPASKVPDEFRRLVQALGGTVRGLSMAGSPATQAAVRSAPFRFGRVPGAAAITGAFAIHDTVREFQRSGFSDATFRTAAGGAGGVAGALKGAALGATIGAFGGPVGIVAGGAIGGVVGGIAGSALGAGIADGLGAARDVIRTAEIDSVDDVFTTGARAAWAGVRTLGRSALGGVVDSVRDIGGNVADAAGAIGDAARGARDAAGDVVEGVKDKAEDVVKGVKDKAEDVVEGAKDKAGDVLDAITPW